MQPRHCQSYQGDKLISLKEYKPGTAFNGVIGRT
jgi:hypothetical protein